MNRRSFMSLVGCGVLGCGFGKKRIGGRTQGSEAFHLLNRGTWDNMKCGKLTSESFNEMWRVMRRRSTGCKLKYTIDWPQN